MTTLRFVAAALVLGLTLSVARGAAGDANVPAATSATGSGAPAKTAEPEAKWVEIPKDQPVPAGSHVRLDISTGQRWVNVAALGASGLPLFDAATHDHDLEHKSGAAITGRHSRGLVAVGPGAEANDTEADADADVLPAAGGAALLARHSKSYRAKVAGVGARMAELDQKQVEPHGDAEAGTGGGTGPRVNTAGLDELLARGLYRQQLLDDDFSAMRARLTTALSAKSSQQQAEAALEELEDLLHDRANAIEFSSPTSAAKDGPMLGLRFMLQLLHRNELVLNAVLLSRESGGVSAPEHEASTAAAVRALRVQMRAAWVVGTAAQNNDKVQGFALADGAIAALLSALDAANQALAAADVPLHLPAVELQAKVMYALSSLLRASATAKQHFHVQSGADVVLHLITSALPATPAPAVPGDPPAVERVRPEVARKAVALVRDVLSDHQFDPTFSYAPLVAAFKAPKYCAALSAAVSAPAATNAVREQLLHVMHLLLHAKGCVADLSARALIDTVDRFAREWDTAHHKRYDEEHAGAGSAAGSGAGSGPAHDHATHAAADPTLHDHAGEESYELELYHVAQAFLHAARNPHDPHDAYDLAVGLTAAAEPDVKPVALLQSGAAVSGATGAGGAAAAGAKRPAPTAGDAHRPETDFEADEDDYVHGGSAEEHTGAGDDAHPTAGGEEDSESSEDEEDDDDDEENPFLRRRYRPRKAAGGYDPDADGDSDADVARRNADAAMGAAGSDDDVDGDAGASDDDEADSPAPPKTAPPARPGRSKPLSSPGV